MTPRTTPASSVATTQGTHDLKTVCLANTTAAIETPRFSAKTVAIHLLYTPSSDPKPTSTRPIRISTPKRRRAAMLGRQVSGGKDRANVAWQSAVALAPSPRGGLTRFLRHQQLTPPLLLCSG